MRQAHDKMARAVADYATIEVTHFGPALGAEVRGVTLADGVTAQQFAEIKRAFLDHQVLFFKNQREIPPARHVEFARMFGELHSHPAAPTMDGYPEIFEIHTHKDSRIANGDFWHSDVSCDELPPLGTMLQIHVLPSSGGDTLFNNMYAAYATLPEAVKAKLYTFSALHESAHVYPGRYADRGREDADIRCPSAVHPVVRMHPDTQRKALYVNRTFTTRIIELPDKESRALLDSLFDHSERGEFLIRFRWSKNDVAFWDNRCCMHRAIWDYWPEERKGRRVTIRGDRPV